MRAAVGKLSASSACRARSDATLYMKGLLECRLVACCASKSRETPSLMMRSASPHHPNASGVCRWAEDTRFRVTDDPSKAFMRITVRQAGKGIGIGGREVGHAIVDTSIVERQLRKLRAESEEGGAHLILFMSMY